MSVELSPRQEQKLHSILDRGMDTLQDFTEKVSRSTVYNQNSSKKLENSYKEVRKSSNSPSNYDKSRMINSELKFLLEKLADLEAKLTKNPEPVVKSREKSPLIQRINENSPRAMMSNSKRKSKERLRNIENEEKTILRLERSITPSSIRGKISLKEQERSRALSMKGKNVEEKTIKYLEYAKKELGKMEELENNYSKLKEEHSKLMAAFEKSEKIRRKQKEIIGQLKNELKNCDGDNPGENSRKKMRTIKITKN
ncbi:hypothetical protein SteCoe_32189 [Stentor coeruleus]|uniref:Uncharacterized protein n=1 Tax=Stentor coeruleus TaxID=5963 RepID=A0A1R2AZN0_9CILI|nr:hypothetical protein SteCoe_32189 [Stentor coeruleus]